MKKCMELEEKLKTMDREISVNPQYVQKVNASFVLSVSCTRLYIVSMCKSSSFVMLCKWHRDAVQLCYL